MSFSLFLSLSKVSPSPLYSLSLHHKQCNCLPSGSEKRVCRDIETKATSAKTSPIMQLHTQQTHISTLSVASSAKTRVIINTCTHTHTYTEHGQTSYISKDQSHHTASRACTHRKQKQRKGGAGGGKERENNNSAEALQVVGG